MIQESNNIQRQFEIGLLILDKKWDEAESILILQSKTNQLMSMLIDCYGKSSIDNEEQYERFLKLIVQQIDFSIQYGGYSATITTIITQLINLSSPKYALVIIRGFAVQIESNPMGKFVVLSNLYLFSALFHSSTFVDLECAYE